jgi:hypothetical protein
MGELSSGALSFSCPRLACGDLHLIALEYKQPNGRRQVGMASGGVNARDKLRWGHPTFLGSLDQSFPEPILNAHARLVVSNIDSALHQQRFHGPCWRYHGFAPIAGSIAHLAGRPRVRDIVFARGFPGDNRPIVLGSHRAPGEFVRVSGAPILNRHVELSRSRSPLSNRYPNLLRLRWQSHAVHLRKAKPTR